MNRPNIPLRERVWNVMGDAPIWMLRVQICGLEGKHDCLAGTREATDPLDPLDGLYHCSGLLSVEGRNRAVRVWLTLRHEIADAERFGASVRAGSMKCSR